jgi:hypothetical protein
MNVNVSQNFPQAAIAFHYYGVMSEETLEVCVDCDIDTSNVENIGGVAADSTKDIPTTVSRPVCCSWLLLLKILL